VEVFNPASTRVNPDFPPSDYQLFTYLRNWLKSQQELMEGVKTWLSSQVAGYFDTGTQKLIPQYKCLNSGGDYVEK
jgi:hypothetical protein